MVMLLQILAERKVLHEHLDLFAIAHPVIRTKTIHTEKHKRKYSYTREHTRRNTDTRPPTTALRLRVTQRYTRHLAATRLTLHHDYRGTCLLAGTDERFRFNSLSLQAQSQVCHAQFTIVSTTHKLQAVVFTSSVTLNSK